MYRLATVVSFNYFPFLLSLLGSYYSNARSLDDARIIVFADGWPQYFVDQIENYRNVQVRCEKYTATNVEDEGPMPAPGVHSDGWVASVGKKLRFTSTLLEEDDRPLAFVDNDIVFTFPIDDIFKIPGYDILLTRISRESERLGRADGIRLNVIGCFNVYLNMRGARIFVDNWVGEMEKLRQATHPPFETPALNNALEIPELRSLVRIATIDDDIICADQRYVPNLTRCIHLKSNGPSNRGAIEEYRNRCSRADWPSRLFAPNYVDQGLFEAWVLYQKYPEQGRRIFGG